MPEAFEKFAEFTNLLSQVDLLRASIVKMMRKPGRPRGSKTRWRPTPIVLEDVRRWANPAFSITCKAELAEMLEDNELKRLICCALFMKGPHENAEAVQKWLGDKHKIRIPVSSISEALTELREDGLAMRVHLVGWVNYWDRDARNEFVNGEWTNPQPLQWIPEPKKDNDLQQTRKNR